MRRTRTTPRSLQQATPIEFETIRNRGIECRVDAVALCSGAIVQIYETNPRRPGDTTSIEFVLESQDINFHSGDAKSVHCSAQPGALLALAAALDTAIGMARADGLLAPSIEEEAARASRAFRAQHSPSLASNP